MDILERLFELWTRVSDVDSDTLRDAEDEINKSGVLKNVAPQIGDLGPDDLQAVAWFIEKENWTRNGWTTKAGEGGSLDFEMSFAGSASAAAQTFSGQLGILAAGAADASEIIGTGLIDSLKLLSDGGSITNVVADMRSLATAISDTTTGIALFVKQLKDIPIIGSALGFLFDDLGSGIIFTKLGKERRERLAYNKNEHKAREQAVKSNTTITKLGATQLSNAFKIRFWNGAIVIVCKILNAVFISSD